MKRWSSVTDLFVGHVCLNRQLLNGPWFVYLVDISFWMIEHVDHPLMFFIASIVFYLLSLLILSKQDRLSGLSCPSWFAFLFVSQQPDSIWDRFSRAETHPLSGLSYMEYYLHVFLRVWTCCYNEAICVNQILFCSEVFAKVQTTSGLCTLLMFDPCLLVS